jgi:hypothetical protein
VESCASSTLAVVHPTAKPAGNREKLRRQNYVGLRLGSAAELRTSRRGRASKTQQACVERDAQEEAKVRDSPSASRGPHPRGWGKARALCMPLGASRAQLAAACDGSGEKIESMRICRCECADAKVNTRRSSRGECRRRGRREGRVEANVDAEVDAKVGSRRMSTQRSTAGSSRTRGRMPSRAPRPRAWPQAP